MKHKSYIKAGILQEATISAILRENHIDTKGDERYILEAIRAEIYGDEEEEVEEENDEEDDEIEEDEDEEENINSLPENPNVNGPIPKSYYMWSRFK